MAAMADQVHAFIHFLGAHSQWAGPVMFIVAFGESLVFVSLLFPGTAILLAAGTLVVSGVLPWSTVLIGAILGAVAGDGISYWIGRRYGYAVKRIWPFTRNLDLIPHGISFFERHGGKSVFIGRFFGPVRAVIPLAAGILDMPAGRFWAANVGSALIWAPGVLLYGVIVGAMIEEFAFGERAIPVVVVLLVTIGIAGIWIAVSRKTTR